MYRFDYLTESIIDSLEQIKENFHKKFNSEKSRKFYLTKFKSEFIYNTNAIDGNRLSAQDTFKIINIAGNLSIASIDVFEKLLMDLIEKSNVIINMETIDLVTSSGLNSTIF